MADKDGAEGQPIRTVEVLERIGGDREFLLELLEIYRNEFGPRTAALALAIKAGNFVAIRNIAHNLKGSSASLGLGSLQRSAMALELAGRIGDSDEAWRALVDLKKEYERLDAYLSRENGGWGI